MNIDYSGKSVLVTGAGGYIGSASALQFASLGATVIASGITEESLQSLVNSITQSGGNIHTVAADLTAPEQVDAMIDAALQYCGQIDVLFNNAGGMMPTPLLEVDRAAYEEVLSVNFEAVYQACYRALPSMVANGGGVIINTTSAAGTLAVNGLAAYGAAKAGVNSLTRSIAIEFGKKGIRANAIAPSAASPNMLAYLDTLPEGREGFADAQPMGRVGSAEEIANAAIFLASDYASFINGVVLPVDGGIEARLATPQ